MSGREASSPQAGSAAGQAEGPALHCPQGRKWASQSGPGVIGEVWSVIGRRRRGRARSVAARSAATGGRARWESAKVQAGPRQADPAWQMDPPRQPQVAWNEEADLTRLDARSRDSVARPTIGRHGAQMPSVYCPGCGEANPETARFCSQCGTPLTRAAADRAPAGATATMIFTGAEMPDAETGDESGADTSVIDALPPNTALLVVKRGPNAGSRFLLDTELTEAGRRPAGVFFLNASPAYRRHAQFYRPGGAFAVRDVGSLNGTYVNRERIEEAALSGGDEVQIGKFRLVFLQGRPTYAEGG